MTPGGWRRWWSLWWPTLPGVVALVAFNWNEPHVVLIAVLWFVLGRWHQERKIMQTPSRSIVKCGACPDWSRRYESDDLALESLAMHMQVVHGADPDDFRTFARKVLPPTPPAPREPS